MIIAVDFDGTLHTGDYPLIGAPRPGAVEYMQRLFEDGHELIIWTCRIGEYYDEMVQWLVDNNIPFDRINEHSPSMLKAFGTDTRKIYADVYVDDHQVGPLPNWKRIYEYINNL